MNRQRKISVCLSIIATLALAGCAHAPPAPEQGAEPLASTNNREHMALAHEKAAGCLRAGHPMAECHQAAMQAMEGHMDHPMKGMGKKNRMGKQGMMQDGPCKMMEQKQPASDPTTETHQH